MKRLFAIILALILAASLAACGGSAPAGSAPTGSTPAGSNAPIAPANVQEASGEIPTVIWWNVGDSPQSLPQWQEAVNAYLGEKIGVHVDYRTIPWGDWPQKHNTIINSGEYFDIMFTDLTIYNNFVSMNAFADLTPLLDATPDLKSFISDDIWKGVTTKNGIFAVPTVKDTARTDFFVIDTKYTDKYGFDPASLNSLAALDPFFRAVKAGEGASFYPFQMTQATYFGAAFIEYDGLGASLPPLGVSMKATDKKAVNTLEQEDVMSTLRQLHTWYKNGIINPDANVATEQNRQRPFFVGIGWPGAVSIWQVQEGVEKYAANKAYGPLYTTDSIQGSLNSISANSNKKEAALKLLEFVNTDHKARDMFSYGIEGVNFEYVKPNVIRNLNDEFGNFSRYSQATFFTMSTVEGGQEDQWDEVRAQNDSAIASPMLGFIMDLEPVRDQQAACATVWERYRYDLLVGAVDPDVVVPQIVSELNAVGFQDVIAEAQRQIDAF